MRRLSKLCAAVVMLSASGCASVVTEGANIARDKVIVSKNIESARAGDREAQYRVGKALCCSLNEGEGFYNTPAAVGWLCAAAERDHGPAALELGDIYSGDVVSGVRVLRRIAQKAAGSTTRRATAYAWYRRAEALDVPDARERAADLWAEMNSAERRDAEPLVLGRKVLLCRWDDVVGKS
jgi:TPR repeat protein